MNYLIFDENEEFFDAIDFDTEEALKKFKEANPNLICVKDQEIDINYYLDDEIDISDLDLDMNL